MKNLIYLALALPLVACSSSTEPEAHASDTTETTASDATETTAPGAEALAIESSTHNVKCGCGIDSIGECGNYVEFDGEYAMLANSKEMGLGAMEWCHKEGVTAVVAGTRTGDSFTATSIAVNE